MSFQSIAPETESPNAEIDRRKAEQLFDHLKSEQNLSMAILGGLLASIVAAGLWAIITYATKFQIGFMAIGVGFLVGFAVNRFGKGITTIFGVVGAVLSLFGCIFGNILTTLIVASMQEGIPVLTIISALLSQPALLGTILAETFSPMDLLFYGIAVYEGYRFSFRQVTGDEIASIQSPPSPPTI